MVDQAAIRVLVVEDEPVAAQAHTTYVGRVPGFVVVATVGSGHDALKALRDNAVDLVLLDMNLPDRHGIDIVRAMRAGGHRADVVAVTSARDLDVVRSAVSLGVVQYVLKPFVFGTLRDRLEAYRSYREKVHDAADVATQADVDQVLAGARTALPPTLPKGMSEELLGQVVRALRAAEGVSATELAQTLGVSRVTARRYVEHLCEGRLAARTQRYAGAGRPEVEYRWVGGT